MVKNTWASGHETNHFYDINQSKSNTDNYNPKHIFFMQCYHIILPKKFFLAAVLPHYFTHMLKTETQYEYSSNHLMLIPIKLISTKAVKWHDEFVYQTTLLHYCSHLQDKVLVLSFKRQFNTRQIRLQYMCNGMAFI